MLESLNSVKSIPELVVRPVLVETGPGWFSTSVESHGWNMLESVAHLEKQVGDQLILPTISSRPFQVDL